MALSAFGGGGMGGGSGLSAFASPPGAGMGGGQLTPQQILMLLQMQGGSGMGAAGMPGVTPMQSGGPQLPAPPGPTSNGPPPPQGQAIQGQGIPMPPGQAGPAQQPNLMQIQQLLSALGGGQGPMPAGQMQQQLGLGAGWSPQALMGWLSGGR
jgi:hypothetical protein